jgi:PKD repeat protein
MNKLCFLFFGMLTAVVFKSTAQQINVNNPKACAGDRTYFTIPPYTLPASANIESYTFCIGPDTVTTTENEFNVLFNPGTYSASAKIKLSNGTTLATNTATFRIADYPTASFSFTNGNRVCNPDSTVCVTNTSIPAGLPLTKAFWIWGDDQTTDTPFAGVCHRYTKPGNYTIRLVVSDSIGCANDTSFIVMVNEPLVPKIGWNGVPSCSGSSYAFTNTHTTGIKSYSWNFGDGQTYSATAPFTNDQLHHIDSITHRYITDGVFTPSISITDSNGCSVINAENYLEPSIHLPANIVTNGKIFSASAYPWDPQATDEQVFCFGINYIYFKPPVNSQFDFTQNWPIGNVWNFGDQASMTQNFSDLIQPSHTFREAGLHIVTLDLSNTYPGCVFYDTIEMAGPKARIEDPSKMIIVDPAQKYQRKGNDTVDFVNTTINYGVKTKITFRWDFNDDYAPQCTAYSVPKTGAVLPFTTAKEQYENSNHFYITNGITFSGKMNCRWSLDSLPRHCYTNWDTVYSWYLNGKTFPASWGLPAINPGSRINVYSPSHLGSPTLLDPFLLAEGKKVALPSQQILSPSSDFAYFDPNGSYITHNGMDTIPGTKQTFYEYLFYNSVVSNINPNLDASAPLGKGCSSNDRVILKFGKPNTPMPGIQTGCTFGSGSEYIFDFQSSNHSVVLINFDSTADRKDATPCTIDGFVGFQGGTTPGGLTFPPFNNNKRYNPFTYWPDGTGTRLVYYYGPGAPMNRPPAADTANGYITIGIIYGTGCANPPFCTQAETYSDTIWYHQAIHNKTLNPHFDLQNNNALFSKNDTIVVTPEEPYQPGIKFDSWKWDNHTITVDSFWYAHDYGLPDDYTNGYFVKGYRRVRYEYAAADQYSPFILTDSIPFPNGYPGVRFSIDSASNLCGNNPAKIPFVKDSSMFLLPIRHRITKTSYDETSDRQAPMIGYIDYYIDNGNHCGQSYARLFTVGIIDTITLSRNQSGFCKNESVEMKGFARYFRCDNSISDILMNPNYSCATNTVYQDPPYSQLNFDTLDFWNLHKNLTADIRYTYINPETNKRDTVYNEKMYWDFGDGSPVVKGLTVKHQYAASGKYMIRMITRDSVGGWDTCTKEITISAPLARISLPNMTLPAVYNCNDDIIFKDSSTMGTLPFTGDSIKNNYWWFGDQRDTIDWQLRNEKLVLHKYQSNGLFRVKLVAEGVYGCKDTTSTDIYIRGPRPYFRMISGNTGCVPFTVKLVNDADSQRKFLTPGGGTLPRDTPTFTTYFDMGDPTKPQIVTPNRHDTIVYTYTSAGQFSIVAYGSDAFPGVQNACPLVAFPDGKMDTAAIITVRDITTNGIVGKNAVALADVEKYSVARTPTAGYNWSVTGGTISAGQGSQTVTVVWSTKDGHYLLICNKQVNGCSKSDTLVVALGNTTGVQEVLLNKHNIEIFPNPARTKFTVKLNATITEPLHVDVYDVVGKNHLSQTITSGTTEHTMDVQSLKPGIYFISIQSSTEKYIQKLLIE